jgi:hypothetical protein
MSPELAMVAAGLLGAAFAVVLSFRVASRIAALDARICEAAARGQALADRIEALDRLDERQRLAEEAIATGTSVVREVHKGIADIPFSILESIPGTAQPTKVVREIHDRISDGVYGALSGLNKAVGREIRKGMRSTSGTSESGVSGRRPAEPDDPPTG